MIETKDPRDRLMREEFFGPIVTTYVYPENEWEQTLELVDETAPYGLTGAVFAQDRAAIDEAQEALALRGRQLLRQRQADRRRRRPAAVRRRARVRHERQGRLDVEPDPLGQPARRSRRRSSRRATTAIRSSRTATATAGRAGPAGAAEASPLRRRRGRARRRVRGDRRPDPRHARARQAADRQRRPRRRHLRRRLRPRHRRRLRPRRADCETVSRRASRRPVPQRRQRAPDGGRAGLASQPVRRSCRSSRSAASSTGARTRSASRRRGTAGAPGSTASCAGSRRARATRPIAYDQKHGQWLTVSLVFGQGSSLDVSRSSDGLHWGSPVVAVRTPHRDRPGQGVDRLRQLAAEPVLRQLLPQLQRSRRASRSWRRRRATAA